MSDLDRAYVINGDDLRIELSGGGNSPPIVPNPRDVAEYILSRIARPLDERSGVRVGQLAAWFREHKIGIFERQPPTASEHETHGYALNPVAKIGGR